jgi:predicted RNA polymerase sigma factor
LTIGRCEHVTALISGARALGLSAESDSSHVFLDYCHLFPDWTWDLQFARIARSPNILRVLIAEGVAVLQAALARDRLGEYQAQAAIAALHADAQTAEETEGVQIVEWYDELVRRTDSPVVRLNRAVAVGERMRRRPGSPRYAELDPTLPRYTASAAYLHERAGDVTTAAQLYVEAASQAQNLAERNHLTLRAATLRHRLTGEGG